MNLLEKLNESEIDDVVSYANSGRRARRNPITSAHRLLQALNTCWHALGRGTGLKDKQMFIRMLDTCLNIEEKRALLNGKWTRNFVLLEPLVMDMGDLPKSYDPANPDLVLVRDAQQAHRTFREKYRLWTEDTGKMSCVGDAVESLARSLYVVRCNLNHSGKFSSGPDKEKVERDRTITAIAGRIYLHLLSLLLQGPDKKIAVYGTLGREGVNHFMLEDCPGIWSKGSIRGNISYKDGLPMFDWNVPGDVIPVELFVSDALPDRWEELDNFEGEAYSRAWIPVHMQDDSVEVASIYIRKPTPQEIWG